MLDLTYETPKPKVISGMRGDWELVIGMEIHASPIFHSSLPKQMMALKSRPFKSRLMALCHKDVASAVALRI